MHLIEEVIPLSLWMVWFIAAVLLVIAEMTTFTFYLLWLGVGALAGGVVALIFPDLYIVQIIVAAVIAVSLTYFTKRIKSKIQGSKGYTDHFDALINKRGEVLETISAGSLGIVIVGSDTWSAAADETIEKGETVVVLSRSSTVLKVAKLEGE